jgi:hypothetical protein
VDVERRGERLPLGNLSIYVYFSLHSYIDRIDRITCSAVKFLSENRKLQHDKYTSSAEEDLCSVD